MMLSQRSQDVASCGVDFEAVLEDPGGGTGFHSAPTT